MNLLPITVCSWSWKRSIPGKHRGVAGHLDGRGLHRRPRQCPVQVLRHHAEVALDVVSFVYGATRHEDMREILHNAYRAATWIVGFMAIIFGVLLIVSWLL